MSDWFAIFSSFSSNRSDLSAVSDLNNIIFNNLCTQLLIIIINFTDIIFLISMENTAYSKRKSYYVITYGTSLRTLPMLRHSHNTVQARLDQQLAARTGCGRAREQVTVTAINLDLSPIQQIKMKNVQQKTSTSQSAMHLAAV